MMLSLYNSETIISRLQLTKYVTKATAYAKTIDYLSEKCIYGYKDKSKSEQGVV